MLGKRRETGFTLIELMIAIVILAILGNVAYPSYVSYIQRGNIGEAFGTLSQFRLLLEQYFQDHALDSSTSTQKYGSSASNCGNSTIPSSSTSNSGCSNASMYFSYSCSWTVSGDSNTGTTDAYELIATGCSNRGMSGYKYSIDYQGNKKTLKYAGTDYSGSPKSCWLVRGNEC